MKNFDVPAETAASLGNGDNPVADLKFCQKVELNSGDKIVAVPKSSNPVPAETAKSLGNGDNPVADSKFCKKVELNSGDKIVAVPKSQNSASKKSVSEFSAKNLSVVKQGKPILHGVSLDLHFGEIVAIVGKNGAGKSTLLHAMARGNVKKSARELARSRAVLSQKCECVFDFSVEEFVNFSAETSRERVLEILRELKIAELRSRRISTLSGGEFQKVQFARILAQAAAGTPNFTFFFDEPTANLDLSTQLEILNLLQNLRSRGAAICVVLHDLRHALRIADRIAILSAGTLVACGNAREILVPANVERYFSVPASFAGMAE